jgi:Tfp pilus assembly protein PilE
MLKKSEAGFTLFELLIVVLFVGCVLLASGGIYALAHYLVTHWR